MLTSLVLQLKATKDAELPASMGRAIQAFFLRWVATQSPPLAETLHTMSGLKPFTVSNLVMGKRKKGNVTIRAGETGWVRFTGLTAEVGEALLAMHTQPPLEMELLNHKFIGLTVQSQPETHPWAGCISYQDFAAPYLLAGRTLPNRITIEFVSPTTFRSNGKYMPLPLPKLVFGSLFSRWHEFSPIALNPEIRRFAEEMVVFNQFEVKSRGVPSKQRGMQIGFTGRMTYSVMSRDRYWLAVLHLLANYAFYSGVGYQTTVGLGQSRVIH